MTSGFKIYDLRFMNGIFLLILISFFLNPTSVHAQSVDLLWEGDTYTPPFYEGRALWSNQSWITVVAIPQGLGNPVNIMYKWSKNGTVLGNISGVGQNTLKFQDTVFSKPQTVKVEILNANDAVLAESTITVIPTASTLMLYEKNPLYGYMFNKEVGSSFKLKDSEVTFSVFPLFATPANRDGTNLAYRWRTNTGELQSGHTVTYRVPEGGSGTSQVNLNLTNTAKILRDISREFLVQFGPVRD